MQRNITVSCIAPDSAEASGWDDYIANTPGATGYHRMGWMRVISRAFGHEVYPLAAFDDGRMVGILPLVFMQSWLFGRFLVSMPFVNYGGLVAETPQAERALLREAEVLMRRTRATSIELRHVGAPRLGLSAKCHKVAMLLDLPATPEELWKGFKDKVRNQVRKARKSGLTVEQGGPELLPAFYDVLAVNMRDLGTPVYSRDFFAAVMQEFPESVRITAVRHGSKVVAAAFGYGHGSMCEVPWASSLREHRKLCSNNLLYWECLSRACEDGYRVFDFGRSTIGSGTWRFKVQWGTRAVPLTWEYLLADGAPLPELNPANEKFGLAIRVWQHLPVALTRLVGPRIVRSIP